MKKVHIDTLLQILEYFAALSLVSHIFGPKEMARFCGEEIRRIRKFLETQGGVTPEAIEAHLKHALEKGEIAIDQTAEETTD